MRKINRKITPEDLHNFRFVYQPAISPNGKEVLFTVAQTKENDSYVSSIWKYTDEHTQLAPMIGFGDRCSEPKWAPGGYEFLFLRTYSEKDRAHVELWVADSTGLNRRKIVQLQNRKILDPKWSRDGMYIFFLSDYDADQRPEPTTDVRLIRRMNYRFDGEGYLHDKRTHVFKIAMTDYGMNRITSGKFDVSGFDLSPDGKSVAFVTNMDKNADFQNNLDIYLISSKGGSKTRKLTSNKGSVAGLTYSPDGKFIAFIGDDYRFKFNTPAEIWLYEFSSRKSRCISHELNRPARNSIVSDVMMDNWITVPTWSGDSSKVFFNATDRGRCRIYSANAQNGKVSAITSGDHVVTSFSISETGTISYAQMDPTHLPELFLIGNESKSPKQITNFNSGFNSEVELVGPREFTFNASDGTAVHGFIYTPPTSKERKTGNGKPACVVEVHGGGGTEGFQFMHEFQCLVAMGYAVITCNFRGTSGYGEDFMRVLTGHYMEKDYSDIIDMVEHAIKVGWVDRKKIGVTGGSYGGYLTNWAIGHSKLFSAAVTDRSVVNLYSFYGTSDDYRLIEEDVQESFPWDRPESYLAKSAINYTKEMQTPLLIMHAEQDFRCRLEQAEQLYAFLKRQGKEVEFAIFPGESHGLSRSGKPHHRIERLRLMLWWFTNHIDVGKRIECPV